VADRTSVGVIGCGFFSGNHMNSWRDLASEGADLVAVCDVDPIKAEKAAKEFRVERWYADAEEMLTTEKLGLVDVVTTMPTHLPLVELTVRHGVPTIVQKPFGQNITEVRRMVDVARDAGVFLAVHENFRYQKPMLEIARLIAADTIGVPNWGRISFRTPYDIYAGQPYLAKETRFVLLDLGVHVLDIARVFMGEVTHLTSELQSRKPGILGEDTATMLCRHENGAVSIVECTYEAKRWPDIFPETRLEIEGPRGSLHLLPGSQIEINVDGKVERIDADPEVPAWGARPWHLIQDSVRSTQRETLRALREGRPAPTAGADNLKTYALCEAAYLKEGKVTV
jgi:D-apiose dehydrogenase